MKIKHLEAIVRLTEIELERTDYIDRSGVYRALLAESLPYLQQLLTELVKARDAINDDRWAQGLPEVDEVTA